MNLENENLNKVVESTETGLKGLIIDFVGNKLNPSNNEVTVELIVEVFAEHFPEFLMAVAEENWVNGYTQALNDMDFVNSNRSKKEEILCQPKNI